MARETSKEAEGAEVPWHAAFPNPKSVAGGVSRDEVFQWLQQGRSDFVLIDLRRMDCEVSGFPFGSSSCFCSREVKARNHATLFVDISNEGRDDPWLY
jgi:hypothetical protein